jgi:putative transposase
MTLPIRKRLPHDRPLWLRPEDSTFFITICCAPRDKNQLCNPETSAAVFESVAFRLTRGDWWVHLLLLMPDHLHMLVVFAPDKEMKKVVSQWKENTAKRIGIQWQRDFFDHRLRKEESVREKADYALNNPIRKGLVTRIEDWPYVWMPER